MIASKTPSLNFVSIPTGYQTHSLTMMNTKADHSARAQVGSSLNIPGMAGKIYTLTHVAITVRGRVSGACPIGGKVELECDALDWKPFEVPTNCLVAPAGSASGCAPVSSLIVPCNKPLPQGSNVAIYYTAVSAATDLVEVTIFWSTAPYGGPQTFAKTQVLASASAAQVSTAATAYADVLTVAIPANKGGYMVGYMIQDFVASSAVDMSAGGKIKIKNDSCDPTIDPTELPFASVEVQSVALPGATEIEVQKYDANAYVPGNSYFNGTVTLRETSGCNQVALCVVWEA